MIGLESASVSCFCPSAELGYCATAGAFERCRHFHWQSRSNSCSAGASHFDYPVSVLCECYITFNASPADD